MIILRNKPKLLYLHGYQEDWMKPEDRIFFNTLRRKFDIDFADISSISKQGLKDFKKINFSKYDLVIGFSMGGLYGCLVDNKPVILVNPGFGGSEKYKDVLAVENEVWKKKITNPNITALFGVNDKYLDHTLPLFKKKFSPRIPKIIEISSKHVPNEKETKKEIIPVIVDVLEAIKLQKQTGRTLGDCYEAAEMRRELRSMKVSQPVPKISPEVYQACKELGIVVSKPWKKNSKFTPEIFNWAFDLGLKENPEMHFRLERDNNACTKKVVPPEIYGKSWAIHMITGDKPHNPTKSMINEEQKQRLFKAVSIWVQPGEYLSSWGNVYPGGVAGLERFKKLGFKVYGWRDASLMPTMKPIKIPIYKKL